MTVLNAEEVVRTYSNMVYKIAYRYVMNPTDADDVYSEAFLRYFKKERTFDSEEHRKAWLIKVTMNCAKDLLIQRSDYTPLEDVAVADQKGTNQDEVLALRAAIDKLPPQQKEIICLFYEHDLTIKQIAATLDMGESAVKVTLYRARERLRDYLEG